MMAKAERDVLRSRLNEFYPYADMTLGLLLDSLDEAEGALVRLLRSVQPYGIGTADLGPCMTYHHAVVHAKEVLGE